MSEPLHTDFKEFLELLLEHEVRFMIVGGYAVSWHGRPRNTEDIDIWIDRDEANARKVVASLIEFGIGSEDLSHEPFMEEDRIFQMGVKPWKIDIFTHIPGLQFSSSYDARVSWPIDHLKFPMISLEDLRLSKKTSARPQDLLDLKEYLPPLDS